MKKLLCTLLALLFCLTTFSACGNGDETQTTSGSSGNVEATTSEATPGTDAPSPFDALEADNFGGHTFNIFYYSSDGNETDFLAETETGDIQNDLTYARNLAVMEKYNIKIAIDYINAGLSTIADKVKQQVQAGDHTYDMFGGHRDALSLSYGGFMYNLSNISALSIDEEWWDQGYVEAMTINDSLYTIIGDMGASTLLFTSALTFNKKLFDDAHLEYPYASVRDGSWTYDKMNALLTDVAQDLNNDGNISYQNDRMALVGWSSESPYSALYTSGFRFMNKDAQGDYTLSFNTEKLTNVLDKANKIWSMDGSYMSFAGGHDAHNELYGVFAEGRAYMADITLLKVGIFFPGMEDDYGIVPTPKYDEDQNSYYGYVGYTIPIAFIPSNAEDPERTGLLMEAFSRASYEMVTPKMLEIVTKTKNVRDEDSGEMIEIVYRNKIVDTAHWFKLSGFGTLPNSILKSGNTSNIATVVRANMKVAEKQWDTIQKSFDKLKSAQ